ncbi:MAG: riboflavin synthase [Candidatus Eremiobacter antarcticus]|nr:riboflavin synthase [Candidatus Eremiobacteraeota bacterium]
MFSGIIRHAATVVRVSDTAAAPAHASGANETARAHGLRLQLEMSGDFPAVRTGDSVAVNGVCLTVTSHGEAARTLCFDVVPETVRRSNLATLVSGDIVNVEPSLRLGDQLGGQFVYGHVDATTQIAANEPEGQGFRLWCALPSGLKSLIVEKGYVALDGVSLTIAAVEGGRFAVALVPETLKRTTLGRKTAGASVNIEADPIARYVAALMPRLP